MDKDFDKWNEQKKKIHENQEDRFSYPGNIWWASLGLNIGSEADGKNDSFERPIIVLKVFNRQTLLIAPLSTQQKNSPYHVLITYPDGAQAWANLSQIRVISSRRLLRYIIKIPPDEFQKITNQFKQLFL